MEGNIGIKMEWHGDALLQTIKAEMEKRLSVASEVVRADAVRSIRVPYPPASTPGNPPHTRSGASGLLGSVFYDVRTAELRAIIGTPLKYGLYLELGTRKMGARPWLRPSLDRCRARIVAIMTKRLPGK